MMDLLVDYFEDELSDEQKAHLEQHLGDCPPCTAFLHSYKTAGEVSRVALERAMPAELKAELLGFLRRELSGSE
jgi:anti-sigma factor RsiW